jgi:hypothetical protein
MGRQRWRGRRRETEMERIMSNRSIGRVRRIEGEKEEEERGELRREIILLFILIEFHEEVFEIHCLRTSNSLKTFTEIRLESCQPSLSLSSRLLES